MTRQPRTFVVFAFPSVHDTLAAEDALKRSGVPATTIPTPHELGELCGIAIRVEPGHASAAEEALVRGGAPASARAEITDL